MALKFQEEKNEIKEGILEFNLKYMEQNLFIYLADPGKARSCSTNTAVIKSLIKSSSKEYNNKFNKLQPEILRSEIIKGLEITREKQGIYTTGSFWQLIKEV